jgi:hypothetical protein
MNTSPVNSSIKKLPMIESPYPLTSGASVLVRPLVTKNHPQTPLSSLYIPPPAIWTTLDFGMGF